MWWRLHAQAFAEALRRLAAQPFSSATSILVLGLALALPVIAALLLRSAATATANLDTDPHLNVYLSLDAADDDVKRIELALRSSPEAASVRFIPRAQALQELKATTHLAEVLASLERNPLPHAFTVRLRTLDADRVQKTKADWTALPKVDQVIGDFEWSERLARWLRFGERLVAGIGALLGVAVLVIVGHLIRLQVLTQRDEIQVSQLIGATAADVRRRFLYHGVLQGALAGLAAIALAAAVSAWLSHEVRALTPAYASDFKIIFPGLETAAWAIGSAALLGLVGAWLAVDRELRSFARDR
jgi:cell division transport system permease protein